MFEVFSYLFSSPPNKKIVWEKKPSINPFLEVNMKCIFCSIWVYRSFDVWPNEWMNSSKWMRNGSIYVEMNDCLKNTFAWYRVFHKHSALVWSVRPSVRPSVCPSVCPFLNRPRVLGLFYDIYALFN